MNKIPEMSGANDSLIIGCVVVLVFGALFYYLHSRLHYAEKRVNVMETILLDFKNASETFFTPTETPSKSITVGAGEEEQRYMPEEEQQQSQQQSQPEELIELHSLSQQQQSQSLSQPQVLRNYESMNIKELQQEARNHNISGISGMRRKELIQALRKSDDTTVQRTTAVIEDLHSPLPSITETSESVEAEPNSNN